MSTSLIGARVPRKEDYRFLTGAGQYTDDVAFAGQTHAAFVRSPHAHANIRKVSTDKAKRAPGVVGVFTGADLAAAKVEAAHPVIDRVARGEHQHRHAPLGGAQAAQHLEAVHLRQADVEDHQIEALLRGGEHRLLAARGEIDGVALGLQDATQAGGERRVILDNQ